MLYRLGLPNPILSPLFLVPSLPYLRRDLPNLMMPMTSATR